MRASSRSTRYGRICAMSANVVDDINPRQGAPFGLAARFSGLIRMTVNRPAHRAPVRGLEGSVDPDERL
jgi:hypothetical protein